MDLQDAMTNQNVKSVREKTSLNRRMCIRFESRKICVAGNECDDSDFDFHNMEHKELPVIKISSDEESEDCQQLKSKGTPASLGTTDTGNNYSSYSFNFL